VKILGASIGNCVHVGGIVNFLKLAEKHGYETSFLGPATPVARVVGEFETQRPDILALSYRLTPEAGRAVLEEVRTVNGQGKFGTAKLIFGGTPEVAKIASELGIFALVVTGSESAQDLEAWLTGQIASRPREEYPETLLARIAGVRPMPILRHHFGRPDLKETIEGCKKIADARVLDVVSIAPDQSAQEFFFQPEQMKPDLTGAGGVPVRRPEDLQALYEASRTGNYPLLRCYSGTNELVRWAQMLRETIRVAWGAIPLFWYSQLDGRSTRPLEASIKENLEALSWYARNGIPVEMNESHHWSLRNAHDTVAVAAAFLAAYNARQQGATTYVQQLMFNNPPGTSPAMDLAKMRAKLELVESLRGKDFVVLREVRTGLTSLPLDPDMAKGHLGSSIHTMMALAPDILHVVGYSEADFAATPEVIIESCKIARGAIRNAVLGQPDPLADPAVRARKDYLVGEARFLLAEIKEEFAGLSPNPWADPKTLAQAVKAGFLDAPHLVGNKSARGETVTRCVNGAWEPVHPKTGEVLTEAGRLKLLGIS